MTDLEKEASAVAEEFFKLPVVKKFLMAKDEYQHSKRLKKYRDDLVQAKKDLNHLPIEKQAEGVRKINKLQKDYDEDAIVVTYKNLKEKVEILLEPIRDLFKF